YKDSSKKGILGADSAYARKYGRSTKDWEENWIKKMNRQFGTNKTDVGQFTADQFAKHHFKQYGKKENRLKKDSQRGKEYRTQLKNLSGYERKIDQINNDRNLTAEQKRRLIEEQAQSQYGPKADMGQFNKLLRKLEGSKMKQQRQRSVEGRRDIYAGGLASMMANF
ncbi:MAG TPA: hypothetical protein DCM40_37755, partial [Maribacter sp.]|nr:hypothetical protein [Maribacter sp.]